eukprot:jgi/Bigna1/78627/fgenesh1_pg.56_\
MWPHQLLLFFGFIVGPTAAIQSDWLEFGAATVNGSWSTVTLQSNFSNPVVITSDASFNDPIAVTPRIRNVTNTSFEISLQEPTRGCIRVCYDDIHGDELVHYVVVEQGVWTLDDGQTVIAAQTWSSNSLIYEDITLSHTFSAVPMIIPSIQTNANPGYLSPRMKSATSSSFRFLLDPPETYTLPIPLALETVGYLAILPTSTTYGGKALKAMTTDRCCNQNFHRIDFGASIPFPFLIVKQFTAYGADSATARWRNLDSTGVDVKAQEEKSRDDEVAHAKEEISLLIYQGATQAPTTSSPATLSPSNAPTSSPTRPSPIPLSAIFADSLTSITVTFNVVTNAPDTGNGCAAILSPATLSLIGSGAACTWGSPASTLLISPGSGYTAVPGDTFTVLANAVGNGAMSSLRSAAERSVVLEGPANSLLEAEITGPSTVGSCGAFSLSALVAAGGGGRGLLHSWTSIGSAVDISQQQSEQSLQLSTAQLAGPGEYNFSVRITDFTGHTATAWQLVSYTSQPIPKISAWTPAVTTSVSISAALTIRTTIKPPPPSCTSGVSTTTAATWTQVVQNDANIDQNVQSYAPQLSSHRVAIPNPKSQYLSLPAYSLKAGKTYGFILTAKTLSGDAVLASTNRSFIVITEQRDVVASIKGGWKRLLPVVNGAAEKVFAFDASSSYDPHNRSFPLTYAWSLALENGTIIRQSAEAAGSSIFNVSSLSLASASSPTFTISVRVTGEGNRSSTASQVVDVTSTAVPIVAVSAATSSGSSKHNPQDRLVLSATVEAQTPRQTISSYAWASSDTSLLDLSNKAILSSEVTGRNLVLRPGALQQVGATYRFSVSVTDSNGNTGVGYASVIANAAPRLGTCYSSPASGAALTDTFRLSCAGWSDEDLPMQYRFQCYQAAAGSLYLSDISAFQPLAYFDTVLPPPPPSSSANVTILASVRDGLDATATFSFQVAVSTPNIDLDAASSSATNLLDAGDVQGFVVFSAGIASLLKSSSKSPADLASARASLLSSVASLAAAEGGGAAAAQLVNSFTDVSSADELSEEARNSALSILSTVANSLNSSVSSGSSGSSGGSDDEAVMLQTSQSSLGGLSNILNAVSGSGSNVNDSARSNLGARMEGILSALGDAQLQSAVEGEQAQELESPRITLVTQKMSPGGLAGSSLNASSGAGVTVPNLGSLSSSGGTEDPPVSVMVGVMNSSSVYPVTSSSNLTYNNATGLVTVRLQQGGVLLNQASSGEAFRISIPLSESILGLLESNENASVICQYWDTDAEAWSTAGVSLVSVGRESGLVCASTHLTAFNGNTEVAIRINTPTSETVEDPRAYSIENPAMVMCLAIFGAYLVAVSCGMYYDLRISAAQGRAASDSFWRRSNHIRISRISSERSAGAFRKMVTWGFRRRHPWFSIFYRHHGDYISSTKRASILLCLLFNTMAVCALLIDQEQQLPFLSGRLSTAFVSMAFCFPVPFVMSYLHKRRIPERFRVRVVGNEQTTTLFGYAVIILSLLCGELMWEDMGGGDDDDDEGHLQESQRMGAIDDFDINDVDGDDAVDPFSNALAGLGFVTAGAAAGVVAATAQKAGAGLVGADQATKEEDAAAAKRRRWKERQRSIQAKRRELGEIEEQIAKDTKNIQLKARLRKLREEVLQLPASDDDDDLDLDLDGGVVGESNDDLDLEPTHALGGADAARGGGGRAACASHFKLPGEGVASRRGSSLGSLPSRASVYVSPKAAAGTTDGGRGGAGGEEKNRGCDKGTRRSGPALPRLDMGSVVKDKSFQQLPAINPPGMIASPARKDTAGALPPAAAGVSFSYSSDADSRMQLRQPHEVPKHSSSSQQSSSKEGGSGSVQAMMAPSTHTLLRKSSFIKVGDSLDTVGCTRTTHKGGARRTITSLHRIRRSLQHDLADLKHDIRDVSLHCLDSVKRVDTAPKPVRCICGCEVLPRSTPNLSTHTWTWHDITGVVLELTIALGCWFLLVLLSYQMNKSGSITDFSTTTLLAFSQDIAFRLMQIIVLDGLMFLPLCALCYCCCYCCCGGGGAADQEGREKDEILVLMDSGILGFQYRHLRVVDVLPDCQAAMRGVEPGMLILEVNNVRPENDKDFRKILKHVMRTHDQFALRLQLPSMERNLAKIDINSFLKNSATGPQNRDVPEFFSENQSDVKSAAPDDEFLGEGRRFNLIMHNRSRDATPRQARRVHTRSSAAITPIPSTRIRQSTTGLSDDSSKQSVHPIELGAFGMSGNSARSERSARSGTRSARTINTKLFMKHAASSLGEMKSQRKSKRVQS